MKFILSYTLPLIVLLIQGSSLLAQSGTSSPYSMFGIGEINQSGFGQSKGMGGTGIAMMSESSLNNINPASYQGLDSLTFLLEAGFTGRQSSFYNSQTTQVRNNATMNHLAIGFRGKSWWAGSIGITPYSSIGNNINIKQTIEGTTNQYSYINLSGTGGINKFYWGNSFKINKHLALGINVSYLFGPINQTQTMSYVTPDGVEGTMLYSDKTFMGSFYFNYGFQYSFQLTKDIKSTIGGIYTNKQSVSLNHVIAKIDQLGDTIETSKDNYSKYTFPDNYGIGITLNYRDHLIITGDYQTTLWSECKSLTSNIYTIYGTPEISLANSIKPVTSNSYNLGIQFMPSNAYNASFLQTIKYRVGAYYSDTYLKIYGEQITDRGFTVGLGIPVLSRRLYANVAFGMGQRGVPGTTLNIINEQYKTLMFNFTLMDFWFVKRQYN